MAVDPRFKAKPRSKAGTPEVPLWAWQTQQPTRYMEGMPAGAVAASTSVAPPAQRIPTEYPIPEAGTAAYGRDLRVQDDIDYRTVYEPQVQPNPDSLTSAIKQRLMAQREAGVDAAPMNMQQQYERPETLPFDLTEKSAVDYEEKLRRGQPTGMFEFARPMLRDLDTAGKLGYTGRYYEKRKAEEGSNKNQGKMMRKEKLEEPRKMPKVVVPD